MRTPSIPKRPNGRGFPRIKRSYPMCGGQRIGQINVSSGTNDPKFYQKLVGMLDMLYEQGDGAALVRIRDSAKRTNLNRANGRQYVIQDVYRLVKAKRHVPNILGSRPLKDCLNEWVESARRKNGTPLSARTVKSYRTNISQLLNFNQSVGHIANATDSEIPMMLRQYREWCAHPKRQYFVPFNQVRTMLRSYSRETQSDGIDSDLYRAIRRVPNLSTQRKRERKALHVWQVKEYMKKLPEREAQHVWNMCCLAARPDEYRLGLWTIVDDPTYGRHVHISGTKTANADRVVPLVGGVNVVPFVDSTFRRHFREAFGREFVPRDFRSTGRQWWKWAGVDSSRYKMYFGHSMAGIEDRYDTHELLPWVASDAERLNKYIKSNETNPQTTEVKTITSDESEEGQAA